MYFFYCLLLTHFNSLKPWLTCNGICFHSILYKSILDSEEHFITTRGALSVGDVALVNAALTHMAPGLCSSNYKPTLSKLTEQNISVDIRDEIALTYMLQNLDNEKSKWVQFFSVCWR